MSKNLVNFEGCFTADSRKTVNQNAVDHSLCTTEFDAVTGTTGATLTSVVGMTSGTLVAGRTYKFKIHLSTVATTNSGLKIGLLQNTASMLTSIESLATGFTAAAVATQHSTTATSAASLFASTTAVIKCVIEGTFVVAVNGTVTLQAAQNAAHADTTSVFVGSWMEFTEIAGF